MVLRTGIVQTGSAQVDASGNATFKIRPTQSRYYWSVSQISSEMLTAPSGTLLELRRNGALIDSPFSARRAAAGGDPPIFLRAGDEITVEWSNATPGDQGRVLWIYDEIEIGA